MERVPRGIDPGHLKGIKRKDALDQYIDQLWKAYYAGICVSDTGYDPEKNSWFNVVYSNNKNRIYLVDSTEWLTNDNQELENFKEFIVSGARGHFLSQSTYSM